jgi:hypothetical protein
VDLLCCRVYLVILEKRQKEIQLTFSRKDKEIQLRRAVLFGQFTVVQVQDRGLSGRREVAKQVMLQRSL